MSRTVSGWTLGMVVALMALAAACLLSARWGDAGMQRAALHDAGVRASLAEDRIARTPAADAAGVVPLVLSPVPAGVMAARMYPIGFPGAAGDPEELAELEAIVDDESEIHYVRADALIAIFRIAPAHARELAPRYVNAAGLLGRLATQIVNEGDVALRT